MAKRTKRVAVTKGGKQAPKKSKAAKRKAAGRPVKAKRKRPQVKAKAKRQITKTGKKRSAAKKSALRRPRSPAPPNPAQTETTIVDVVEEPVPGVLVVTEFVETHPASADTTDQLDVDRTVGPESEEK